MSERGPSGRAAIGRLHVITDEAEGSRHGHQRLCELALAGGADTLQYREKRTLEQVPMSERLALARQLARACTAAGAALIVDDDALLARAAGAHGVHLGQKDLPAVDGRTVLGPHPLIGGTANSLEEARRAFATPIDYLGVGPVFGTRSKHPAPAELGLAMLRQIAAECPVPVIAIGGIQPDGPCGVEAVMEAGAHGVAVLSGISHAEDPVRATRAYVEALGRALARLAPRAAPRSERADVVVVGGGIIGLAVAYELCSRGRQVRVLDRRTDDGAAWRVAAGMLAPAFEADTVDPRLIHLSLASCRLYPELVARVEQDSGLNVGYRPSGSLLVALNPDHREELTRLKGFADRLGVESHWLSAAETLEREPLLSPRLVGSLSAPGDHQVDPRAFCAALAVAVERLGGQVVDGASVLAIDPGGSGGPSRLTVRTGGQAGDELTLEAEAVVLCPGAFPPYLLATDVGALPPPLPLRPVKGQVLRLHGDPLIRHVVRTPEVYLVPRENGELVVGATSEEQGFDRRFTAGAAHDLLREAFRVLPGIYELELGELGVGFRPALRDHLPAIGPLPGTRVFLAAGHYRNGVMLAAGTARWLAEMVSGAAVPELLAPFTPARFGLRAAEPERVRSGSDASHPNGSQEHP